jgi:hypothetical protein
MSSTKEKMSHSGWQRSNSGWCFPSSVELVSRINLTLSCPPCLISPEARFLEYDSETDIFIGNMGVAVALVGYTLDQRFLDRGFRAHILGWEWSYLCHFEMALTELYCDRTLAYDWIASLIGLPSFAELEAAGYGA